MTTFRTITAADWRTAIARARSTPNSISQQIRKQLTPTDAATRPDPAQERTGEGRHQLNHMNTLTIKPAADFRPDLTGAFADLPFDTYAAAPGINKSGLDTLRNNPRKFRLERDGEIVRETTAALEWGTLIHETILFGNADYVVRPETYGPESKPWNNNAKECREWNAAHAGKPVLTASQADDLRWQADAVLEHPLAQGLLTDGLAELSLFARDEDRGFLMKARLDYYNQGVGSAPYFLDIKTTLDASTHALSREILQRRYHVQFAMYRRVLRRLGLDEVDCFIIALEKGDMPRCQVRKIASDALDLGDAELDADLRLYWSCRTHDYWPDFADEEKDATTIRAIDLPEYAYGKTDALTGMTQAT